METSPLIMKRDCHSEEITPLITAYDDAGTGNNSPSMARLRSLRQARRLLYVSHLFSQFSEISWQFCLVLFLAAFANYESYLLVSTYGVASGLVVCLFGSKAGRFIDGTNRLVVAQRFIWTENAAVLVATLLCYVLLVKQNLRNDGDGDIPSSNHIIEASSTITMDSPRIVQIIMSRLEGIPLDTMSVLLLVGIHILGATAQILDRGFVVAIERDWIVVMSRLASSSIPPSINNDEEDNSKEVEKAWLSETNVTMKQIDLSCQTICPAIAGFFIAAFDDGTDQNHGGDLTGAALFVGALNVAALFVEYSCTAKIYHLIPELAIKPQSSQSRLDKLAESDDSNTTITSSSRCYSNNGDDKENVSLVDSNRRSGTSEMFGCGFCKLPQSLQVYLRQPTSLSGLGLSLLYLNVLCFGGIMTAFLVWRGMRLQTIGVWRGISSSIGLMGTFAYFYSIKYMSIVSTGMWSIAFQFLALSVSYASLFVDHYNTSLGMLIGGVCASRVGLWVFDISVTQLMQEYVEEDVRGVVGGVQQSLNALFSLLSFALGILMPDPRDFFIYVGLGYGSVGVAMLLYGFGVFRRQSELESIAT